jgi:hypothetical protein
VSSWTRRALRRALTRMTDTPVDTRTLDSTAYALPPRLARYVKARDITCLFPACPRLARACQNDHLIAWPTGRSVAHNISSECTHHHQAKHAFFTVTRLIDGTLRWRSPTGLTVDRPPRPFLQGW